MGEIVGRMETARGALDRMPLMMVVELADMLHNQRSSQQLCI